MYFEYGETEIACLKARDSRLSEVIDKVGHVYREVDQNIYASILHQIIGQQISTKALATVWKRVQIAVGEINAANITELGETKLQSLGITHKKAQCIIDFSKEIVLGKLDLDRIATLPDAEAIEELSAIKGVGVWTAEMILLFGLQRQNILSYNDLAIQRGLRMIYHHRKIDRKLFEHYRRRFSPHCSVASLYIWAVAGNAIPEMKDYLPKKAKG